MDAPEFAADRDAVIARAHAAGVTRMVTVGYNQATWETATALVRTYAGAGLYLALGIHPNSAYETNDATLAALPRAAAPGAPIPRSRAWSAWARPASTTTATGPRPTSSAPAFRAHLALARELDLPVIIHDRDAHADIMAILRARRRGHARGDARLQRRRGDGRRVPAAAAT